MTHNINQQIIYQIEQITHAKTELPKAVQRGTVSEEFAAKKIEAAEAILCTLKLVRAACRGEGINNV